MKIWFQKHTVQGRLPGLDRAYAAHVQRIARPETEVHFFSLPDETYQGRLPERYVRYGTVESLFALYFSLQALRAERAGYDAFVIGTSQDPGLLEARGWAEIPVLGYGETAAHVASMTGQRFAFVGFIPDLAEPIGANMRRYGLADRMAPFVPVDAPPQAVEQALEGRTGTYLDAFHRAARTAAGSGADVLIPGDGLTNEVLIAAGMRDVDGTAVLDANGLLVKAAELFVDLRVLRILPRPAAGYYNRRPDAAHVAHLLRLFAPKVFPPDAF